MKKKHLKFNLITALVAFVSLSAASKAAANLSFSAAQMTATTFSVDISGTLPTQGPPDESDILYVVSTSRTTAPFFVQPSSVSPLEYAASSSFGSQTSFRAVGMGTDAVGEGAIGFDFGAELVAGADFFGTLTATWENSILVPSAASSLEYYWGDAFGVRSGGRLVTPTGVLLGSSTVVPEPSAAALLLGLGAMGLAAVRRRSRD